jgi:1,4-dihydroxy-2-naphthoate octaprenyltransferase
MNEFKHLLGPMRVPFLILTPACVLLGLGTAVWTVNHVNVIHCILVFLGSISAHISVNAFNEYFDFKSGLDFKTQRTPFSGGSGTLPANPHLGRYALKIALVTFVTTCLIGLYFLFEKGLLLLPLGVLGVLFIFAYTPWVTRHPFLSLIVPGLGFGPIMVMGTHYVLAGEYSWAAFIASLVPFFLVNNLLLLNQFPDVEADRSIGRSHFPIIIGKQKSTLIYGTFLLFAYLSVVLGVWLGYLPPITLISLATAVAAIPAFVGAYRHAENTTKLIPFMGLNVIINIVTPVLVATGLLV